MKNRDNIIEALADHATESASQSDLIQLYFDDQEAYFKDMPLSELKEWAVDLGLMKEDEEIE
jgi:hypothetical protein